MPPSSSPLIGETHTRLEVRLTRKRWREMTQAVSLIKRRTDRMGPRGSSLPNLLPPARTKVEVEEPKPGDAISASG